MFKLLVAWVNLVITMSLVISFLIFCEVIAWVVPPFWFYWCLGFGFVLANYDWGFE